jgi:hypothetical protein
MGLTSLRRHDRLEGVTTTGGQPLGDQISRYDHQQAVQELSARYATERQAMAEAHTRELTELKAQHSRELERLEGRIERNATSSAGARAQPAAEGEPRTVEPGGPHGHAEARGPAAQRTTIHDSARSSEGEGERTVVEGVETETVVEDHPHHHHKHKRR